MKEKISRQREQHVRKLRGFARAVPGNAVVPVPAALPESGGVGKAVAWEPAVSCILRGLLPHCTGLGCIPEGRGQEWWEVTPRLDPERQSGFSLAWGSLLPSQAALWEDPVLSS